MSNNNHNSSSLATMNNNIVTTTNNNPISTTTNANITTPTTNNSQNNSNIVNITSGNAITMVNDLMSAMNNISTNTPADVIYVQSCDLNAYVQLCIKKLDGYKKANTFQEKLVDPYLRYASKSQSSSSSSSTQLDPKQKENYTHPDLFVTCQVFADGKPCSLTSKTRYTAFRKGIVWEEWLTLPIAYRDLPRNAVAAITVWDIYAPRQIIPVGGTTISLFGKHGTLRQGFYRLHLWPGVEADGNQPSKTPSKLPENQELVKLEKQYEKLESKELNSLKWLDEKIYLYMEEARAASSNNGIFLSIDFPKFNHPVVYHEMDADISDAFPPMPAEVNYIFDPDAENENLIETKHKKLARNQRRGPLDKLLKPDSTIRDQLNNIIKYPPTKQLTSDEKDLVWRFRFHITKDKRALVKFLKCVDWVIEEQAQEAINLMKVWVKIDIDDALGLLSSSFTNPLVRQYAVEVLEQAADDELQMYLLQLVQALKYEGISLPSTNPANLLSLVTEIESENNTPNPAALQDKEDPFTKTPQTLRSNSNSSESQSSLARFLIRRAADNTELGVSFYWYLVVEFSDPKHGPMYKQVAVDFQKYLENNPETHGQATVFRRQMQLTDTLVWLFAEVRKFSKDRPKRIERLQAILHERLDLTSFDPLPLPLDPKVLVTGIIPEKASMFKSNLCPLKLHFKTTANQEYIVIFKSGDDLRQDQLILQIIMLMDRLLRKENLDLKLTPYKTLALNSDTGFVEFVDAHAVAHVLEKQGSIQTFFKKLHPTSDNSVSQEVMDTYVKSVAGYCVITYLLGVGDRHLDNLLLTENGHLFHIDFGYILGRDPKPFPPPMKLAKEMVEAMGGANSKHYQKFLGYCYNAFLILRKSSNLILNLFTLMVDSSVPDIANEPDKAVAKVQEKFRLDLSEEAAVQYFQSLIDDSVSALFPQMVETIHKWAQYWRK